MASGVIFSASDRMITVGHTTEYEPPSAKHVALTSSIVALAAGDMALQIEILREVHGVVTERIANKPDEWLKVKDVVDLYLHYYAQAKLFRAETAILAPLGLNRFSYLKQDPLLTRDLMTKLMAYTMPSEGVQTIFTGIDPYGGPHIYVTDGMDLYCCDTSGYATIGTGSSHASSHFMLSRHSWNAPIPDTLLRVFIAKKRAETAPGVGQDTDMLMIGPTLGQSTLIRPDVMSDLEKIYGKLKKGEAKILEEADKEIQTYVENMERVVKKQTQGVDASTGTKGIIDPFKPAKNEGNAKSS
jgi:hypothetical protein